MVAVISGTVGVPEQYLPVLAALEIAGAAGILLGVWLEPLGVLAAAGLVTYFAGAVGGHLRVRDTKNLAMLLPPLVLAVVVRWTTPATAAQHQPSATDQRGAHSRGSDG